MRPSDFYLGISEFFSIVVPGFLVTVVGCFLFGEYTLDTSISTLSWMILAIASYIIGHILFAIGTKWDEFYETHKPKGNKELLNKIDGLRGTLHSDNDCTQINNYQWCRSALLNNFPDAYMDVARKEADSKLFRSLIVPLSILAIYGLLNFFVMATILSAALAYVSYLRYKIQRFKACKTAYTHIITLSTLGKMNAPN